jgi:hypothetical protein
LGVVSGEHAIPEANGPDLGFLEIFLRRCSQLKEWLLFICIYILRMCLYFFSVKLLIINIFIFLIYLTLVLLWLLWIFIFWSFWQDRVTLSRVSNLPKRSTGIFVLCPLRRILLILLCRPK